MHADIKDCFVNTTSGQGPNLPAKRRYTAGGIV